MGCGHGFQPPKQEEQGGHRVFCVKFQRDMQGLDEPPFDHPLGQRIFDNVSKEAWHQWFEHWKMVMNEYRVNLGTTEGQNFYLDQLEKYFFGQGAKLPDEFVAPKG